MEYRRLYIPVIMLICFSYPITTVILLRLGVELSGANQIIKAALVVLCAASLMAAIPRSRNVKGALLLPLLAFFAFYGLRLVYDVAGQGILMGYQTPIYVYGYFFGLTLLPVVTIMIAYDQSDLPHLYRWTLISLVAVNFMLLFHSLTAAGFATDAAFSGRVEVAGDLEQTAVLNPLTFGIMGAMLSAFVMGFLTTANTISWKSRIASLLFLALGGVNILFSASRGPALAFALVVLVTIYSLLRGTVSQGLGRVRKSTWIYLFGMLAVLSYLLVVSDMEIFLFDRFSMFYENRVGGAEEERDFLFANAWADFIGSPIFGNSYAVSVGYASPHNVFLESLMAVGLIGTAFFAISLWRAFAALWQLLHGTMGQYGYTIALSTLCIFVLGLTSYSIGQSPELWIFVALITLLGSTRKARFVANPPKLLSYS